jgi:hypothetical protein
VSQTFDAIVLRILSSIDVVGGSVSLPVVELEHACASLLERDGPNAEGIAEQILIVLARYHDALGLERTGVLTAQLCILIALCLRSTDKARALLLARGLHAEDALLKAAAFLDQRGHSTPVSGDVSSSSSVFNALLRSKREK